MPLPGCRWRKKSLLPTSQARNWPSPQPKGPGRNWTISEIEGLTKAPLTGRSFANGEKMYAAALSASCHQFKGEGGAIGPDLTQLGTRFGYKDIAEAIIEPSKVISDQYDSKFLNLKNGKVISGRIMKADKEHYLVSSTRSNRRSSTE